MAQITETPDQILASGAALTLAEDAERVLEKLRAMPVSAFTVGELLWVMNIAQQLPWCQSAGEARRLQDEAVQLLAKAETGGTDGDR